MMKETKNLSLFYGLMLKTCVFFTMFIRSRSITEERFLEGTFNNNNIDYYNCYYYYKKPVLVGHLWGGAVYLSCISTFYFSFLLILIDFQFILFCVYWSITHHLKMRIILHFLSNNYISYFISMALISASRIIR